MLTASQRRNLLPVVVLCGFIAAFGIFMSGGKTYNVPQANLEQAQAMIDAGATVVDVRGKGAYDMQHLAGAISLPLERLRAGGVPDDLAAAKDKPVLVYCGDGVTTGPEATALLMQAGFKTAVNMTPGFGGWRRAGLPTVEN